MQPISPAPFAPENPRLREKHLARREILLKAALELVAEEGLAGLTIARLAKRTGSATGALYRYFPGKDDVIAALQQRALHDFGHALHKTLDGLERDRERQGAGVDVDLYLLAAPLCGLLTWRQQAEGAPEAHALLDAMLSAPHVVLDEETMRATEAELNDVWAFGASLFDEAVARSLLSPGDSMVRVRLAWACLHGIDHMKKRDRVEPPSRHAEVLATETLRALFRGWGADATRLEAALELAFVVCRIG